MGAGVPLMSAVAKCSGSVSPLSAVLCCPKFCFKELKQERRLWWCLDAMLITAVYTL